MICAFVEGQHTNWDLHIQKFALALRTVCNDSTKVTPAMLNLGREITLPFDRSIQVQNDSEESSIDLKIQAIELDQYLKDLIKWVRHNMEKAQVSYKKYYDQNHRESTFKEGQLVLVRNNVKSDKEAGFAKKLAPKWIGPFIIVTQVTPVTYSVRTYPENYSGGIRHVQDLKPYFPRLSNREEIQKPIPEPEPRILRQKIPIDYRKMAGLN